MRATVVPLRPRTGDPTAADEAADEAIAQVLAGVSAMWIPLAATAARRVAVRLPSFTTDAIEEELAAMGAPRAPEPRALGAVMRELAQVGIAEPTPYYEKSTSVICHARPKRVWRSLVYVA